MVSIVKSFLYYSRGNGKWRIGNCQEYPEEISKRGSLSGSPSVQKHASTRLQLLTKLASLFKRTQRNHPYSRPPTHPSGSVAKSSVWKHCRKKTKISTTRGSRSPFREFSNGGKCSWNPGVQSSINLGYMVKSLEVPHQCLGPQWDQFGGITHRGKGWTRGQTWESRWPPRNCILAWKWAYTHGSTSRTCSWERTRACYL